MNDIVKEADKEFLKLRCLAVKRPYPKDEPSVWMPTTDIQGVNHELAKAGFIVGWPIAYKETGTMINAMEPGEILESGKLEHHQTQVHGRARAVMHNGTVGLQWEVHREALSITDPSQHIHNVDVNYGAGQRIFVSVAESDLSYDAHPMDSSWSPDPLV